MVKLAYVEAFIENRYIYFHSTCMVGRRCTKYFWEVEGSLFRVIDKKFSV